MRDQKKPRYSVWQNVCYMMSSWWKRDKKGLWVCLLRLPPKVLLPLIMALLPKLMMDCLQSGSGLGVMVGMIVLLSGAIALISWIDPYLDGKMSSIGMRNRMSNTIELYRKVMDMDYENAESQEGKKQLELASHFTNQNDSGGEAVFYILVNIGVNLTGIVTYTAILTVVHPLVFLLIGTLCIGDYIIRKQINRLYHKLNRDLVNVHRKMWYIESKSKEAKAGKDIRLYRLSAWFMEVFGGLLNTLNSLMTGTEKRNVALYLGRALFPLLRNGIAYAYLLSQTLSGSITVPDFVFYIALVTGFSNWVVGISDQLNQLDQVSLDCNEFRAFMEMEDHMNRGPGAPLPVSFPCEVEFEDVTFQYPGADSPTLRGVSFHVGKGEKIALVGVNGAGKTTCMKLLCGLYRPTRGRILVNGRDVSQFNRDEYYNLFTCVFQDVHFWPMSVEKNIALCDEGEIDRARLEKVLRTAGIWERIERLENGTKTMMVKEVWDKAAVFSGGEQQKLLLARALYQDAPILILDEPTAALDPIAEYEMYQKYGEMTNGKTSFYISHRLSSTHFCDRILFLKDGCITESGSHEELMEKGGGYAEMFRVQSHYYQQGMEVEYCG